MKSLFVEVKYVGEIKYTEELFDALPERVVLCGNIQYLDFLSGAKEALEAAGKQVVLFGSRHGQYPGQILGCDVFKFEPEEFAGEEYAFVYLGDGLFHPTALLYRNDMPVIMYEPRGQKVEVLDKDYLVRLKKQKMARLSKFLVSKNIGVLVTSKPGQNQSAAVRRLRAEMEGKGKNIFVFVTDNIHIEKLGDFNFIDMWVNTGCPRIVQDFSCVNLRDLMEMNYFSGEKMVF